LRDDCFALPAGVDWVPVDQALAFLKENMQVVTETESIGLAHANGRILARQLAARVANPPRANSAVDGYGFAFSSLGDGDQVLPLVSGRSAAGTPFSGSVPSGYAIRILTGGVLPEGVDTVILQEDVTIGEREIAFHSGLKTRANTRQPSEDVGEGGVVLEKGRIRAGDLALCAAVGIAEMQVYKPLRVAVLSTGDELIEAGETPHEGSIFDANRPMLLAAVENFGYTPIDMGRARDDRAHLRQCLDKAAESADVILTSGGASAGDEDHLSALLNEEGAMQMWRIAVKPGRPLALGMWKGKPVFGLPGNPVAALVCTLIFARPAMGVMAGEGWLEPQGFEMPANFEKRKKAGRREYLRARIRDGKVEVFPSEGSGRISGLSWADGLVELSDEAQVIAPGDNVRYIPYCSFGL